MLTISYAPSGSSDWTSALVLCSTSRSVAELGVEFNHERVITVQQLATNPGSGIAALAQDYSNVRNTLSLRVRRGVDFATAAFADPEAAFVFALTQPAQFPNTGTLKIAVAGATTTATLYLLNCGMQRIRNRFEDLGIAPVFDYTFNGGLITATSPF